MRVVIAQAGGARVGVFLQFDTPVGLTKALSGIKASGVRLRRRIGRGCLTPTAPGIEPDPTDMVTLWVLRGGPSEPTRVATMFASAKRAEADFPAKPSTVPDEFRPAPEPHAVLQGLCRGDGYQFLWRQPHSVRVGCLLKMIDTWLVTSPDGTVKMALAE